MYIAYHSLYNSPQSTTLFNIVHESINTKWKYTRTRTKSKKRKGKKIKNQNTLFRKYLQNKHFTWFNLARQVSTLFSFHTLFPPINYEHRKMVIIFHLFVPIRSFNIKFNTHKLQSVSIFYFFPSFIFICCFCGKRPTTELHTWLSNVSDFIKWMKFLKKLPNIISLTTGLEKKYAKKRTLFNAFYSLSKLILIKMVKHLICSCLSYANKI